MKREPCLTVAAALAIFALLGAPGTHAGEPARASAPPADAAEQKFRARREVQGAQEGADEKQRVNEQRVSELGDQARPLNQQQELGKAREGEAQRETAAPPHAEDPARAQAPPAAPPRHRQLRPALPQPVQKRPRLHTPVTAGRADPRAPHHDAHLERVRKELLKSEQGWELPRESY